MKVWQAALAILSLFCAQPKAAVLPRTGIGIFIKPEDLPVLREKVRRPPCQAVYQEILKKADVALAKWPQDRARIVAIAPQLPDLVMETVPAEYAPNGAAAVGRALADYAEEGAPAAALVYLVTGDRKYGEFAWAVFEQCARVNRWGWFPWGGSHMPQIHFGNISRNQVFIADAVWNSLTAVQQQRAREVIAEKCVEPYYRIVLHTPGMGLFHLRSRNQGNNALSAALIGSVFVDNALEDNRIWFNSLLQTYHWLITHDIGWMGQGLELNLGGYWDISMQNLYTAAVVLKQVKGIDLRVHPGFEQATYFPMMHETTVPPMNNVSHEPISPSASPSLMGVLDDKPLSLPADPRGAAWWLDYAANFPDTPAHHFARTAIVRNDRIMAGETHQGMVGRILEIVWWNDKVASPSTPPTPLALFTDRMATVRSGYGFGHTYLYFNGDLFLSAKKEILGGTSGLSWHFPWHQYQVTETGVETEGELFAPSMGIREANNDERFAWFRAEPEISNVSYYPQIGQLASHRNYAKRSRGILYVRGEGKSPDYFVFDDVVRHRTNAPLWHAWTWHFWSSSSNPANAGQFVPQGKNAVRALRPNADLWIQFVTPRFLTFETHSIPSQPLTSYDMDHNARMLRAVAGLHLPAPIKPVIIPPAAWTDLGSVQQGLLYVAAPPTGRPRATGLITNLMGGVRYRWSVRCKEQDYVAYEATAWEIGLELLDSQGRVVAEPNTPYGHPHPLKLGAPLSSRPTHDWTETAQYFDAPTNATACRATFRAVGDAHIFKPGKLWLSQITLMPIGHPYRNLEQRFLVIVMPLDKGAPPPVITTNSNRLTRISRAENLFDELALAEDGSWTLTQYQNGQPIASFSPHRRRGDRPTANLISNSPENAKNLAAGLRPVTDRIAAERDFYTRQGRENLAARAKVSASAFRDHRFPPEKVNDQQTAEYPVDGFLNYTQGMVKTSWRFAGYSMEQASFPLVSDIDLFPLYVVPTYWLLPEYQQGWIELALERPAAINLVRLLNTSNAGLNDFATHTFRVELYDVARRLLAKQEGSFGKAFDRPFQQAFFVQKWFNRYTRAFEGMLDPGLTVPFGDGWKEVVFNNVAPVSFVRIVVTKHWGIGGGLNEVQVYSQNSK